MKIKEIKKLLNWAKSNLQAIDFIGYSLIKFYNQKYFNSLLETAINAEDQAFYYAIKTLLNNFYLIENLELIKPLKNVIKENI